MKQRYAELSHDLIVRAVMECLDHKWRRKDALELMEKHGGIPRRQILQEIERHSYWLRLEAVEGIALEVEQRIEDLLDGDQEALDLDEVKLRPRIDGMTGKLRQIACCCLMHQVLGHLLRRGLDALFRARIEPTQFASIPGRGQTGLMRKARRAFRQQKRHIRYAEKTDVANAYGTAMYADVVKILRKEVPSATWIIAVTEALGRIAPGGHLIIGGYIDAWYFNLLMSYAVRDYDNYATTRRGKTKRAVTLCISYMDDIGLCGPRLSSIRSAAAKHGRWLLRAFGMRQKQAVKIVRILSGREERALRKVGKPSPGLDMGGFVVHRSYISIRRAIFLRIRRQLLRAWRELRRHGTVFVWRARKIIAYHGYFRWANARKAVEGLQERKLLRIAKRVVAAHERMKGWRHNADLQRKLFHAA